MRFIEKLKNDRCSPFSENFSENLFSGSDAYPMQGADYKQLMNTRAKKISRLLAADTNILLSKVGIVLRP